MTAGPEAARAVTAGPGTAGPEEAASSVTGPPHPRLPRAGARGWVRRRRGPAVVAGLAVCTAAVVTVVLLQRDGDPAAAPGTFSTATGAAPGQAALPGARRGSDRASSEGVSRQGAGATADGDAARPEGFGTATARRTPGPTAPTAPTTAGPPAGSATPAVTSAPASPAAPPGSTGCAYYAGYGRTLLGDSGKRVLQVQCMLSERGYGLGGDGVSGDFGTGTESAVRAFQGAEGLPVDGVVGHGTWAALRGTG